jgi:hypothetical protein
MYKCIPPEQPQCMVHSDGSYLYLIVAQPFYTCGTLNIVEESFRHTNPILHIVGGGGGVLAFLGRDKL